MVNLPKLLKDDYLQSNHCLYQQSGYYTGLQNIIIDTNEYFYPCYSLEQYYLISNRGRVYSLINNCLLKLEKDTDGYIRLHFKNKHISVHRLVMMTFEPIEHPELFEVNHKNFDITCNYWPENLEWTTPQENYRHAYNAGKIPFGENHFRSIFTESDVLCFIDLLMRKILPERIAEIMHCENTPKFNTTLSAIRSGRRWKYLTKNLIIPGTNFLITYDEIFFIADLVLSGKNNKEIIEDFFHLQFSNNMEGFFNNIKNKLPYIDLSNRYNFPSFVNILIDDTLNNNWCNNMQIVYEISNVDKFLNKF